MAVIREHLARKGLGLHNDLQNEHVDRRQQRRPAADDQRTAPTSRRPSGSTTSPKGAGASRSASPSPTHGSDATHMETHRRPRRRRVDHQRREDVEHRHPRRAVRPDLRPHERQAPATATASPRSSCRPNSPGFEIVEFLWTFNMPTDHAHIRLTDVRVPAQRDLRRRGRGPAGRAALLQREPHPPGRVEPRRRAVLHRPSRSSTPRSARRSASRSRRTRRSSSRSSSCRRSARCCAR